MTIGHTSIFCLLRYNRDLEHRTSSAIDFIITIEPKPKQTKTMLSGGPAGRRKKKQKKFVNISTGRAGVLYIEDRAGEGEVGVGWRKGYVGMGAAEVR